MVGLILESIFKYSTEQHKILIVETSDSTESKLIARDYCCLFQNTSLKYELGAYKHAINAFPDEKEYFMFQDSLEIIQQNWESVFRDVSMDKKIVALAAYDLASDPCPGCGMEKYESITGLTFPVEHGKAILCNSFYMPQYAKKELISMGIMDIPVENKVDTYDTERVVGAMASSSCGIDSLACKLGEWEWSVDHFVEGKGFMNVIKKNVLKRQ